MLWILLFCIFACRDSKITSPEFDTGRIDDSPSCVLDSALDSAENRLDTGLESDSGSEMDSGEGSIEEDEDVCLCPAGQAYVDHECAPTLSLGCNELCNLEEGCSAPFYTCVECATPPGCDCASSCVLAYAPHSPVEEPLRIEPTSGIENAQNTIRILGAAFYIGALGHRVRYVDSELGWSDVVPMSTCTMEVTLPPKPPGIYPLWVSQYSGGPPWVLAGFFHSGASEECVQPGAACDESGVACCIHPDVSTSCQEGRCMRNE